MHSLPSPMIHVYHHMANKRASKCSAVSHPKFHIGSSKALHHDSITQHMFFCLYYSEVCIFLILLSFILICPSSCSTKSIFLLQPWPLARLAFGNAFCNALQQLGSQAGFWITPAFSHEYPPQISPLQHQLPGSRGSFPGHPSRHCNQPPRPATCS